MSYPEGEVWRSRTDGTEKLQLTRLPLTSWGPSISPDGKQILFDAFGVGGRQGMYLVSIDGGSLQPLAIEGGRGEWCGLRNSIVFIDGPAQNSKTRIFDVKTSEILVHDPHRKLHSECLSNRVLVQEVFSAGYESARMASLREQLHARMAFVPGVSGVAFSSHVPLLGFGEARISKPGSDTHEAFDNEMKKATDQNARLVRELK